ncbi:MAG: MbcA/ParS/Xre antitoxin family protein [Pseudomonadota bacterium]|nr:MbcA/ParS/Xre antitoxin family protein [Pseudomonadota bacterium]
MKTSSKSQHRLADIKTLAIETFGAESKANHWLNSANLTLGDTPIYLAKSEYGAVEVRRILSAIAYGGVI